MVINHFIQKRPTWSLKTKSYLKTTPYRQPGQSQAELHSESSLWKVYIMGLHIHVMGMMKKAGISGFCLHGIVSAMVLNIRAVMYKQWVGLFLQDRVCKSIYKNLCALLFFPWESNMMSPLLILLQSCDWLSCQWAHQKCGQPLTSLETGCSLTHFVLYSTARICVTHMQNICV